MDLRTALKPVFGENPEQVEGVFLDNAIRVMNNTGCRDPKLRPPVAVVVVDDEVCRIYEDIIAIRTPGFSTYIVVA